MRTVRRSSQRLDAAPATGCRSSLHRREGGSPGDPLAVLQRVIENMYDRRKGRSEEATTPGKPRAAREKFGRGEGAAGGEGGRDSQPSLHRSYWWRVYRIVPPRKYSGPTGSSKRIRAFPGGSAAASVSVRMGEMSRADFTTSGTRRSSPGSVQGAFRPPGLHS